MAILRCISVKESREELQARLRKASAAIRPRLKMLLLINKGILQTTALAAKVGVSPNCIGIWKQHYANKGLLGLAVENRGGHKKAAIHPQAHQLIKQRLADPKGSFTSYKQAQAWINETFGLCMHYHAVNKYLKQHFHTKLKVGRKTHISKDPVAEAAFKKGARR